MISIALADDEALFRRGMNFLIEDFEGMEVVWEVGNGQELLDKLGEVKNLPDVLLLDLNMPEINGIEAAKIMREQYPDLRIVVLSSYFQKSFIVNMIEIGAASYLPKNTEPDEMERTIREVVHNGFFYTQPVMEVIRQSMMDKSRPKEPASFQVEITNREREILQLICDQYTTSEIAKKLYISPRTVDGHRNNMLQKFGCRNTAGLVVYALQNKLVSLTPGRFWAG